MRELWRQSASGEKVTVNVSAGYVIDIKAVSTMNCPMGYETLINYKWDGTDEGCNCPTMLNNYYYEFILPVSCLVKSREYARLT